jgi:hypothetical protein
VRAGVMLVPVPLDRRYIDVRAAMGFAAIHMAASQGEGRPSCRCCMCKWRDPGTVRQHALVAWSSAIHLSGLLWLFAGHWQAIVALLQYGASLTVRQASDSTCHVLEHHPAGALPCMLSCNGTGSP